MKITRTDNLGELAKKVFLKEAMGAETEDHINQLIRQLFDMIDGFQKGKQPREVDWVIMASKLSVIKEEWERSKNPEVPMEGPIQLDDKETFNRMERGYNG